MKKSLHSELNTTRQSSLAQSTHWILPPSTAFSVRSQNRQAAAVRSVNIYDCWRSDSLLFLWESRNTQKIRGRDVDVLSLFPQGQLCWWRPIPAKNNHSLLQILLIYRQIFSESWTELQLLVIYMKLLSCKGIQQIVPFSRVSGGMCLAFLIKNLLK